MDTSRSIPALTEADSVKTVVDYSVLMRSTLALPPSLRSVASNSQTITATAWSPLPTTLRTSAFPFLIEWPTGCSMELRLTFGCWTAQHAGTGDLRIGARLMDSAGAELAGVGTVGCDWSKSVGSNVSVERNRVITLTSAPLGMYAEFMAYKTGTPTTAVVAYPFLQLTPIRFVK